MNEFKIGDVVECVEPYGDFLRGGWRYTVAGANARFVRVVGDEQHSWWPHRFRKVSDDGWVPWSGGPTKPVQSDTRVCARFRNGQEHERSADAFRWWWWNDGQGRQCDIVAYRVIQNTGSKAAEGGRGVGSDELRAPKFKVGDRVYHTEVQRSGTVTCPSNAYGHVTVQWDGWNELGAAPSNLRLIPPATQDHDSAPRTGACDTDVTTSGPRAGESPAALSLRMGESENESRLCDDNRGASQVAHPFMVPPREQPQHRLPSFLEPPKVHGVLVDDSGKWFRFTEDVTRNIERSVRHDFSPNVLWRPHWLSSIDTTD